MWISDHVRQDGVMSTAELLAKDFDFEWIRIAARYRRIIRVRKGWYASPAENENTQPTDAAPQLATSALE